MEETEENAGQFSLSLSGDGLELKRQITSEQAGTIISLVLGGHKQITQSPAAVNMGATGERSGPATTIGEYLEETGAKTIVDKIVAAGRFLNDHENTDRFTRADIQRLLRIAREPNPANFPRDFGKAVKARFIQDLGGDVFGMTKTGLERVATGFTGSTARRTRALTGRNRRKSEKGSKVGNSESVE